MHDRSSAAVDETLYGRTLKRSSELLGQIRSYLLLVAGVAVAWFSYVKIMGPVGMETFGGMTVVVAVMLAPLLLVFVFDTFPQWRDRRHKQRLIKTGLGGQVRTPGYFRLKPYEACDHKDFQRADGAHERVLEWIAESETPLLYLSGRSGTGKSSLLNAYVLPKLERKRPAWVCVPVRSYGEPIAALMEELRRPGRVWAEPPEVDDLRALFAQACAHLAPKPLLVAVDQFEEFVILHDEVARSQMEELLRSLVAEPIKGLRVLLVVRSDYLGLLEDLDLPKIRQSDNWSEIAPFTETHSRHFLRGSGLDPGDDLLDAVLSEGVDLEETRGLVRPITLNLLGLILGRFSNRLPKDFRAGKLIEGYLREAVGHPELQDTAPRVLRHMITSAGTKQPRSAEELVQETDLRRGEVRGCLVQLANQGLVRCLDESRDIWEVSHDFIARQLDHLVTRWQIALWRRWRPWLAPVSLVVWFTMGLLLWPVVQETWAIRELSHQGGIVKEVPDGGLDVFFVSRGGTYNYFDLPRVQQLLVRLAGSIVSLDLSKTRTRNIEFLARLTELQALNLSHTQVAEVSALASLTQLQIRR